MQLTEVKPLRPFVGSYPCALVDADIVDDALTEKDGVIIKTKVPKKRFVGLIPVTRFMSPAEIEAVRRGEPPPRIEVLDAADIARLTPGKPLPPNFLVRCIEHPPARTVLVPPDLATSLVERGLAELVGPSKAVRK